MKKTNIKIGIYIAISTFTPVRLHGGDVPSHHQFLVVYISTLRMYPESGYFL